ncbi:hypothetical protein TWF281_000260 [Arthrobotrys megalospora]
MTYWGKPALNPGALDKLKGTNPRAADSSEEAKQRAHMRCGAAMPLLDDRFKADIRN